MFAFPGDMFSDPYAPRRPTQRYHRQPFAAQPQDPYAVPSKSRWHPAQARSAAPTRTGDMYDDIDSFPGMMFGMDPYEMRQRKLMEQKQREEEQQERARRLQEKKQLEKQRKQLILQTYNRAATKIQKAFRAHLHRKRAVAQQHAACIITRVIRAFPAVRRAKNVVASLKQLKKHEDRLRHMTNEYQEHPWGYRHTLWFIDQVEKLILQLDEIQHFREDFVRHRRKDVVQEAQLSLRYADCVLRTFKRKVSVIIHALKDYLMQKHMSQRDCAARIIQRAVIGMPKIHQARRVRDALKNVRDHLSELRTIREKYAEALQAAERLMDEHRDLEASSESLSWFLNDMHALAKHDLPVFSDDADADAEAKMRPAPMCCDEDVVQGSDSCTHDSGILSPVTVEAPSESKSLQTSQESSLRAAGSGTSKRNKKRKQKKSKKKIAAF
eukprot:gene1612-4748_t